MRLTLFVFLLLTSCASHLAQSPDVPEIKDMTFITGGCFRMGDRFSEGYFDEKPVHKVCLDDYYIDTTEVTQEQYLLVTGNNPSAEADCMDCPVETVSWFDAVAFCEKVDKHLPTEAQWEFAATSRGQRHLYSGETQEHERYAWTDKNSQGKLHRVAQKEPNLLGIYDMSGNVWEWIYDWYNKDYYSISPRDNPTGPKEGVSRIWRGGSWYDVPWVTRTSARYQAAPYNKINRTGFRCAKN